ncbi:hypothetical protein BDP27DRAFT_1423578 [Rhodocollybia butyracea]|uniref:Uncharacterized protein n=1 Tax=Rhodocollybia butyracea TaxID=206335 RepID=A0A9P5U573_9AGAR|nr:hypothetical protein BDP27DRAFT_1423578 [Rhodocollybia butyracea]
MPFCIIRQQLSPDLVMPLRMNFVPLVGCLSVALTSRMILNLNEAATTGIYTVDHSAISGIAFSPPEDSTDS